MVVGWALRVKSSKIVDLLNVFGFPQWFFCGRNPVCSRAKWFCSTAKSQVNGAKARCTAATVSCTGAKFFGSIAPPLRNIPPGFCGKAKACCNGANPFCSTTQFTVSAAGDCGSRSRRLMAAVLFFGCMSLSIHTRSKGLAGTGYKVFLEIFMMDIAGSGLTKHCEEKFPVLDSRGQVSGAGVWLLNLVLHLVKRHVIFKHFQACFKVIF